MADVRSAYTPLEDSSTQAGLPLHRALEGETVTGKNAHGALVAKDGSSNFSYLKVNTSGELLVNGEGDDVACLAANGSHAGSTSKVEITGASIALQTNTVYKDISISVSCFRDTVFDIVWDDDGSDTILASVRVGPGQFTLCCTLDCSTFTSGATEATGQKLRVDGINTQVASTMDASIQVKEVQ